MDIFSDVSFADKLFHKTWLKLLVQDVTWSCILVQWFPVGKLVPCLLQDNEGPGQSSIFNLKQAL